ncbi:MAG TPA: PEGA domain-containing protein [Candidatus Angelobacter sp.]|jgi:hypothetical protein
MKPYSILAVVLFIPIFAFAGKDPSEYPLRAQLLEHTVTLQNAYNHMYRASGLGNIWEGEMGHAFDYTYDCSYGLKRTARNHAYSAKWKKPQLRLTILGNEIGEKDKYRECELKTSVHEGVYLVGAGGSITEISQAKYKELKNKATVSRLSISSTPGDAEIEVDGEFMGNTPSTQELGPGEHTIKVTKAGYKTWEKKVKLPAGAFKLNADMEAEK